MVGRREGTIYLRVSLTVPPSQASVIRAPQKCICASPTGNCCGQTVIPCANTCIRASLTDNRCGETVTHACKMSILSDQRTTPVVNTQPLPNPGWALVAVRLLRKPVNVGYQDHQVPAHFHRNRRATGPISCVSGIRRTPPVCVRIYPFTLRADLGRFNEVGKDRVQLLHAPIETAGHELCIGKRVLDARQPQKLTQMLQRQFTPHPSRRAGVP